MPLGPIRDALELAAVEEAASWPDVEAVGGWWNRRFDPEVDLVGADAAPVAKRVVFVGSVKWLHTPFDGHDLTALTKAAPAVPGFEYGTTGSVVVTRSGTADGLDLSGVQVWGPDDVLSAWR